MPLTNYLMQTAICTSLFYGWGFGLWAQVGPAGGLVLSLADLLLPAGALEPVVAARHERGPLEALWARLTYGRTPPQGEPGTATARP
jgi:uncharacterized protein